MSEAIGVFGILTGPRLQRNKQIRSSLRASWYFQSAL